jgi:desulfoferrodoxin (superoxide reductase-like protein)
MGNIALAHPPDSLKMSFDSTGTVLTITTFHTVKNPSNHYINSIIVERNGKEIIKQSFLTQYSNKEQIALYKIIDVKKDDKITVTAQCNVSGRKKQTLVYQVEEQK